MRIRLFILIIVCININFAFSKQKHKASMPNSKEEMFGFVIGYNEAITNSFAEILGYNYYELNA